VPTLVHDEFALYETSAITRYIDRTFAGPALQPQPSRALGRMDQIIGVVDAYGYWPLVRQVFSHRVFRPAAGQPVDEAEVARGLAGATKVLGALEALAAPDAFLAGPALSLADFHLGAMIAYFAAAPEGAALLEKHPRLAAWWERLSRRKSFAATDPGLPII
jgi:glutathione S-transferase